ncbi:MAG: SH3 domain-containing protein [Alistipes finegoldii]
MTASRRSEFARQVVHRPFVLHEGTVVTITDRLDGWCEVVIADGKKGWVEGRKIEII